MLVMEPRNPWVLSVFVHSGHVCVQALHSLVYFCRGANLEQAGFFITGNASGM